MSLRNFLRRGALLPLAAALLLAGCVTTMTPLPSQPEPPARFRYSDERWTIANPAEAQDRGAWWHAFGDPVLSDLVDRAGNANTDVRRAAARLSQARALARSAAADRAPQLGVGASANRVAGANTAAGATPSTLLQAGATLSYELDLFGRLQRTQDAATLDARARAALLQSTRLMVQAETAQAYLTLRALDAERALVLDTVTAYRDTLRLTERRFLAGDLAELDVARVQTELASTESDALALDRRRAQVQNALAVLVGETASSFNVSAADWTTALPTVPPGIPATVLARRPDVAAAQSALLAAQARVGAAQAAWFPRIALTADGGFASPELGDLFKWSSRAWGVGALLSLPLLDGGRRDAGVKAAQAQLDESLAGYRGQVLAALRDVEDQLAALRLLQEQARAQDRAVTSARRATLLSDSRYRNGMVSQLELLDARRSELSNRRQALQVRAGQYQATVGLIRALGGGWDSAPRSGDSGERRIAHATTAGA